MQSLLQKEKDELGAKTGQNLWIAIDTTPDISCNISILASKLKNAPINELIAVKQLINKLKDNKYIEHYKQLHQDIKILLYTDAAFGNVGDGGRN